MQCYRWLLYTHMLRMLTALAQCGYAPSASLVLSALASRIGARVQWFTAVKAVLNTLMVRSVPGPSAKL